MARINQNLSDVKDEDMGGGGWTAWEQGDYRMMVSESSYGPTKDGKAEMLKLTLVCLDDEHNGQKKFDNLVLVHPNPDVCRIARAKLKELAIATGHPTPDFVEDSDDLHNKPVLVYITKKKAKPERREWADVNGFENNVTGYKSVDEDARTPLVPPPSAPSGPPPSADDVPF